MDPRPQYGFVTEHPTCRAFVGAAMCHHLPDNLTAIIFWKLFQTSRPDGRLRPLRQCGSYQANQALPGRHLIEPDQEQLVTDLFAPAGVLGINEGNLPHRKAPLSGS